MSTKINELEKEIARLRGELEKANNEFGSMTADWPDLWKRIADLKSYQGKQFRYGYIQALEEAAKVVESKTGNLAARIRALKEEG